MDKNKKCVFCGKPALWDNFGGICGDCYSQKEAEERERINKKNLEENNRNVYNQALEDVLKLIATLGIDWEVKNSDIEWLEKSIQGLRK